MNGMFHIAKVVDVFGKGSKAIAADSSVQAHLEMWDENILIFDVHPMIADKIAKDQIVLVEYSMRAPQVPENVVVKILETKQGEEVWKRQKNYLNQRKKQIKNAPQMIPELDMPVDARMVR